MPTRPSEFALSLPLPETREGKARAGATPLEQETIELFDEYRVRLLRYVFTFGVPAQDAEEIVQEVFLALFRHLRSGRPRHNLRGWIFRVAHNLALKQRMANSKIQQRLDAERDVTKMQIDPSPNPEEEIANGQQNARYRAILKALPEQDQRCLYLRAEGLRYREIAKVVGVSLGAVAMSLTRSLARFRRAEQIQYQVKAKAD
jgi:RNA polymerase sigma-70 factor (ECF subfamily)